MHVRISSCSQGHIKWTVPWTRPGHNSHTPHHLSSTDTQNLLSTTSPKLLGLSPSRRSCHFVRGWHTGARKLSKWSTRTQRCFNSRAWRHTGGYHTACLDYTQEGAQRASGGRSLSSNSTMKAESWSRGSFTSLCYSYPGISSFDGINLLFSRDLKKSKHSVCSSFCSYIQIR